MPKAPSKKTGSSNSHSRLSEPSRRVYANHPLTRAYLRDCRRFVSLFDQVHINPPAPTLISQPAPGDVESDPIDLGPPAVAVPNPGEDTSESPNPPTNLRVYPSDFAVEIDIGIVDCPAPYPPFASWDIDTPPVPEPEELEREAAVSFRVPNRDFAEMFSPIAPVRLFFKSTPLVSQAGCPRRLYPYHRRDGTVIPLCKECLASTFFPHYPLKRVKRMSNGELKEL